MRNKLLIFLLLLSACALPLAAANFKLYMKDGDFHLVREYSVEGDRVKFYSIDRSDWEEVPAALVDLKRTEAEGAARKQTLVKESQELADEEEAARTARAEIRKIPQDPGVYRLENGELRIFKEAESVVHSEKGKNALKKLAPLPVFAGKSTVEIAGPYSQNIIAKEDRPEFFLQLSEVETFAIVKVTTQKQVRVVEKVSLVPMTNEVIEERTAVPIFQKQLSDNGLYKIWPQEPMEKGEYAVMEYTEGKMNQKLWDFRIE
jgi:hypothetical protein